MFPRMLVPHVPIQIFNLFQMFIYLACLRGIYSMSTILVMANGSHIISIPLINI